MGKFDAIDAIIAFERAETIQPPVERCIVMSKPYLSNLRAISDQVNLRGEEAQSKPKHSDRRIHCDTPLTDQIEALMRNLPPVQRKRPWSMDEFVARLEGRYSTRPHAMHVGQALRALGWASRRDWTREGGGRRCWVQAGGGT